MTHTIPRKHGLGRRPAPDARDVNYPIRATLLSVARPVRRWRYWWDGAAWGDQGDTPRCVGFAWAHFYEDGPITHRPNRVFKIPPETIYNRAQRLDEWPGEAYAGTSVRAGAKAMQEFNAISEYRWAFSLADVIDTVKHIGPMVVGFNWYTGFYQPNAEGVLDISGSIDGGHAFVLNGCNDHLELFRMKNSWGRAWGNKGRAYIPYHVVERLLGEDGEACIAIEKRVRR